MSSASETSVAWLCSAVLCFALLRQSRLADDGNAAPGDADQHSCMAVPGVPQVANAIMVGMQSLGSEVKVDGQEFGGAGTDDQQ